MRIWRIVLGDLPITSEAIRTSVEASVSLDHIRYHLGLPFISLKQAQRVCHWLETHEVEPNLLRSAGRLFCLNDFSLRPDRPSVKRAFWLVMVLIVTYAAVMLSLAFLTSERTYYTVRSTGTTFSADQTTVRTVGLGPIELTADACKAPRQISSTLDAKDQDAMCEFLLYPKLKEELAKGRRSQTAVLLMLGLLLAVPIAIAVRHGSRAFDIKALADKLAAIAAQQAKGERPTPAPGAAG